MGKFLNVLFILLLKFKNTDLEKVGIRKNKSNGSEKQFPYSFTVT